MLTKIRIALAKWLCKDLERWVWIMNPCHYGMHPQGRIIRLGVTEHVVEGYGRIIDLVYECRQPDCDAVIYSGGFLYEDESAKASLRCGHKVN